MTTMKKVKSSNIKAIGYNPDTFELLVEFKGGKTFSYKYISSVEYEALINAESVGSHFSKFIKNTKVVQVVITEKASKNEAVDIQQAEIKTLKDRLNSITEHMIMIERIAMHAPIDKEILALTKEALEIDKAKSNT